VKHWKHVLQVYFKPFTWFYLFSFSVGDLFWGKGFVFLLPGFCLLFLVGKGFCFCSSFCWRYPTSLGHSYAISSAPWRDGQSKPNREGLPFRNAIYLLGERVKNCIFLCFRGYVSPSSLEKDTLCGSFFSKNPDLQIAGETLPKFFEGFRRYLDLGKIFGCWIWGPTAGENKSFLGESSFKRSMSDN